MKIKNCKNNFDMISCKLSTKKADSWYMYILYLYWPFWPPWSALGQLINSIAYLLTYLVSTVKYCACGTSLWYKPSLFMSSKSTYLLTMNLSFGVFYLCCSRHHVLTWNTSFPPVWVWQVVCRQYRLLALSDPFNFKTIPWQTHSVTDFHVFIHNICTTSHAHSISIYYTLQQPTQ